MKKILVLLATGFAILVLFFLAASGDHVRRQFGASADALAGSAPSYAQEEGRMGYGAKNEMMKDMKEAEAQPMEVAAAPSPPPPPGIGLGLGTLGRGRGGGGTGSGMASGSSIMAKKAAPMKMKVLDPSRSMLESDKSDDGEGGAPAPTRAWFPETFLFEPLVTTDATGHATVPVKVPDRLTTWRVLALAHSRQGGQAGATTSFLGTLPTYVEPVVPPMLYAGDKVTLPIQVVNTTERDVSSALTLESTGVLSSAGGTVRVSAGSNVVQNVSLTAPRPGPLMLKATLGTTDAVERVIDVKPAGQRENVTHGGTLAAPRTFALSGPLNALPSSESVVLRVFPGALGLVRSELSAAPGRGGVAEDAYLLQLLGSSPALLRSLGEEPNLPVIRDLSVLATQRVMRHSRSPSVDSATLLAEAALAHPENPVLARLGERLAAQVAQAQRPDGTCQGADGWTLQRLLVTTGDCVRAVKASQASPRAKQRFTAVSIKAAGAYERNLGRINDPYTAAAALASGAVTGTVAEKLKATVLAGITSNAEGAVLSVPAGVVRADGLVPSPIEATALAVLALDGDAKAPLADLGTTLLGAYDPFTGWGDGRTNLLALRAITTLFKEKVPAGVKITLERDGKAMASGELTPETLKSVLVLEADATGSSGEHSWSVKAEPAVPGLGYTLGLSAYVPWKESKLAGLELETTMPPTLKVGQSVEVAMTAAYPGGTAMKLRFGLPAGVQHDTPSLDALVSANTITRYETEDGAITLHLPQVANGDTWEGKLKVIPTLGGTLQAQPTTLSVEYRADRAKTFVPKAWVITN
ncbi:MAG: alpha-2-macroglobulin family protein [Myxococcales bacterium]|nr:alpha-2-macroglobulin family protein [Myxococcales bacterium]